MNTFTKISVWVCALSLLFLYTGCSSDNGGGGGIPATGKISAKIDGNKWEATGSTGTTVSASFNGTSVLTVTATGAKITNSSSNESETFSITVYSLESAVADVAEQSYDIAIDQAPLGQFTLTINDSDGMTTYTATSGEVTITDISEDGFKGTFEGTLTNSRDDSDTKKVTDGGFNVEFGFNFTP